MELGLVDVGNPGNEPMRSYYRRGDIGLTGLEVVEVDIQLALLVALADKSLGGHAARVRLDMLRCATRKA